MTVPLTEGLRRSLTGNRVEAHGPLAPDAAAALVVERARAHAAGSPVAVAAADPLVSALGVIEALSRAEIDVLLPDDNAWRGRLPDACLGITGCMLAVAETGSLALEARPGSPRGVSLLPPVHLCLLSVADIVATFPDAIALLAGRALPSALTWVGGPSRTGDLEMIQTLGVHGPAAVEVVLVDPTGSAP